MRPFRASAEARAERGTFQRLKLDSRPLRQGCGNCIRSPPARRPVTVQLPSLSGIVGEPLHLDHIIFVEHRQAALPGGVQQRRRVAGEVSGFRAPELGQFRAGGGGPGHDSASAEARLICFNMGRPVPFWDIRRKSRAGSAPRAGLARCRSPVPEFRKKGRNAYERGEQEHRQGPAAGDSFGRRPAGRVQGRGAARAGMVPQGGRHAL
jgi:hypothetical protein